jgi:2-C-methyl-D-erythritol 4-phosphate cytidylyltransferase
MNRRYRKTIIAGNWKMNKTATEAKKFADDFKALLPKTKWCDVVVCVPSVDISAAVRAFKDSRVAVTVPRDGLWQAQTPQMFRHGLLSQALAISSSADITDEASAIERLGLCPRLVRGDASNFKVTYAQDIRLAAALLSAGQN